MDGRLVTASEFAGSLFTSEVPLLSNEAIDPLVHDSNSPVLPPKSKKTSKPAKVPVGGRPYPDPSEPPVYYSDREATEPVCAPVNPSMEPASTPFAAPVEPLGGPLGALIEQTSTPAGPSSDPSSISSPVRVPAASPSIAPAKLPRMPLPALANGAESPLVRHNQLGDTYSIKLVYPGFYLGMSTRELTTTIGFPLSKERLAKRVLPGHLFFIYVTSPERKVIGLAQASGHAVFEPEQDFRRPWSVQLVWLIGPKSPGVGFADIGLQVKARIGDTTYAITDEVAAALIDRLQDMADLSSLELSRLKEKYRLFC